MDARLLEMATPALRIKSLAEKNASYILPLYKPAELYVLTEDHWRVSATDYQAAPVLLKAAIMYLWVNNDTGYS
jgi:hypothetical protein